MALSSSVFLSFSLGWLRMLSQIDFDRLDRTPVCLAIFLVAVMRLMMSRSQGRVLSLARTNQAIVRVHCQEFQGVYQSS
jgi:hypothetical protein